MASGRRVGDVARAERINAAAELLAAGQPAAETAGVLAERVGISVRQARRYVDHAQASGPVAVPEASVVFTVKLPASLASRVRAYAHEAGIAISTVTTRALTELLERGYGKRSRR